MRYPEMSDCSRNLSELAARPGMSLADQSSPAYLVGMDRVVYCLISASSVGKSNLSVQVPQDSANWSRTISGFKNFKSFFFWL